MPATVQIYRKTGSGPTNNDITGINTRIYADDTHTTAGTVSPILIPASGSNYSFWATFQLNVSAITAGTVSNIKWYTDGTNSLGTGVTVNVSASATSYVQATGTVGTTGNILNSTNYTGVGTPSNAFTYTSASPLTVTGSTSTTGAVGNLVVMQIAVASTAAQGTTAQETITWQYDDTSS
jgi:hypothetical protein